MKTTLSRKFIAMFFTLCMALSFVPIPAFATEPIRIDRVDFTHEIPSYSAGQPLEGWAKITGSDVNYRIYDEYLEEMKVVEKNPGKPDKVAPTGRYWHSNPIAGAHVGRDNQLTELDPNFSYWYYVVFEPKSSGYRFTENTEVYKDSYKLGTPQTHGSYLDLVDSSFRLQYLSVASVSVSGSSEEKTITDVSIVDVNTNLDASEPVTFTAQADTSCANKFDITEESWEAANPINDLIKSTDESPHAPKAGGEYWYGIKLTAKDGYVFSKDFSNIRGSGSVTFTVNGTSYTSYSGNIAVSDDGKTLTAWEFMAPITATESGSIITYVAIENAKFDYQLGSTPQPAAKRTGVNQDKYDILYECWQKQEKGSDDTLKTVGYWYSDESCYSDGDSRFNTFEKGGRYKYSIKLKAKDGYTFHSNLKNKKNIRLNGESLPFGTCVDVMDEGKTCLITYGTEMRPGQAVKEIRLDGAVINFNAGDKPSFSGVVDSYIDIDHQCWDSNDDSGYGITSSDFWNRRYNGKLITEFEAGKSYTYGVYFKISALGMEEGYRFDKNTKLYINGQEITLTPEQISLDDTGETIWLNNVLTMTPEESGTISDRAYEVIEGANSSWVQNSDEILTFRINGDLSKFVGIKVDDEWVDKENYVADAGSTIVTLKNEYLKTLSVGEHKITFIYTDGEASTNFEVKESGKIYENSDNSKTGEIYENSNISDPNIPKTGDNISVNFWLISALGMLMLALYNRKKKYTI